MEKFKECLLENEKKNLEKKCVFLLKHGFCSDLEVLNDFNPSEYIDMTYGEGYKGYHLYQDGDLYFFASKIDEESEAYQGVYLEAVSDIEYEKIQKIYSKNSLISNIFLVIYCVLLVALGFMSGYIFFEYIEAGFIVALSNSLLAAGGAFILGIGILVLILKKDRK